MKLKDYPTHLISFFFLLSCTQIIQQDPTTSVSSLSKNKNRPTYCLQKTKVGPALFTHTASSTKFFYQLLNSKKIRKQKLSFIEKVSLFLLFQMNSRPDLSSPSSRLQVLISIKNGPPQFWDIHSPFTVAKKGQIYFPYLEGIEILLKAYPSKRGLKRLGQLLDVTLPKKLKVDKELAKNIFKNKSSFFQFPTFKEAFFKGAEPLKENESLPKLSFSKILKDYFFWKKRNRRKGNKALISQYLFSSKILTSKGLQEVRCNVDLSLYKHSIFLIGQENTSANLFGLKDQGGSYFIGTSSQSLKGRLRPLLNSFLIKGSPSQKAPAFCLIHNPQRNSNLSLVSYKGRDPGQHLFNLIKRGVHYSGSLMDLDIFLRSPRKLFLVNPLRVLIEPLENEEQSYQKYRNKNIPLYPVGKLGSIMAYGKFPQREQEGFVLDKRASERMSCLEQTIDLP